MVIAEFRMDYGYICKSRPAEKNIKLMQRSLKLILNMFIKKKVDFIKLIL